MKFGGTGVVTRQGQITLPKNAREEGDFEVGTIIEFFYSDDIVLIKRRKEPKQVFEELAKRTRERFEKEGIKPKDVESAIAKVRARRNSA
ncbi:MAG: AbrB/MazE/SpoVT family DNA-binding domain-containing protein [Candidatus Micrarchaeota archaeon]